MMNVSLYLSPDGSYYHTYVYKEDVGIKAFIIHLDQDLMNLQYFERLEKVKHIAMNLFENNA